MARIYTRTGDKGITGLANGERLSKNEPRVMAMGDVDELNSMLGILASLTPTNTYRHNIEIIQGLLFELGAELANPGADKRILISDVDQLEIEIDQMQSKLEPLKQFILPGGDSAAALCHQARAICRRAERQLLELDRHSEIGLQWLNRLSDWLFVFARLLNIEAGQQEASWQPRS